jgi:hypothetical protein
VPRGPESRPAGDRIRPAGADDLAPPDRSVPRGPGRLPAGDDTTAMDTTQPIAAAAPPVEAPAGTRPPAPESGELTGGQRESQDRRAPGHQAAEGHPRKKAAAPARATTAPPRTGQTGKPAPPSRRPLLARARRRSGTAPLVAVSVVVAVAVVIAVVLSGRTSPGSSVARQTAESPLERQEAANDNLAATWIAQQVSRDVVVWCDKQLCTALAAKGFPAGNIRVLGPTSQNPQGPGLVVETATVRALFGTILASEYAPVVLTTIGSGKLIIKIRVVPAGGWPAYRSELAKDLANRQKIGADLLGSSQIVTSPEAHAQLAAGAVDLRLLVALTALAGTGSEPVNVVDFGNEATAQSPGVPLRYADLALRDKASHLSGQAYLSGLEKVLDKLPAPFQPLRSQTLSLPGHGPVLRILFGAPTPLGLLAAP